MLCGDPGRFVLSAMSVSFADLGDPVLQPSGDRTTRMWRHHPSSKTETFCAMLDVDALLHSCPSISRLAADIMKLSSLCDRIGDMTALSFSVTSAAARLAALRGGRVQLVPPRSLDAEPDYDSDHEGAAPQREQPLSVKAVLGALLYHMRCETGEEWCRSDGGYMPPLAPGVGRLAVPLVEFAAPAAVDVVDGACLFLLVGSATIVIVLCMPFAVPSS